MKVRNLFISIEEALDLFDRIKWKFFTIENGLITLEIPRSDSETWKVIKKSESQEETTKLQLMLLGAGFIEQEVETELEY